MTTFSFAEPFPSSDASTRKPKQWDRFCHQGRLVGTEFLNKVVRFNAIDGEKVSQAQGATGSSLLSEEGGNKAEDVGLDLADVTSEWDTTQNALWDRHVTPGMIRQMTPGEIGCALSHVSLWKELAQNESKNDCEDSVENTDLQSPISMLIFEDDAVFLKQRPKRYAPKKYSANNENESGDRFLKAFRIAYDTMPNDWDIFYLGLSDRGERKDVISGRTAGTSWKDHDKDGDLLVQIFRPTYGFHTHAYAIRQSAASKLLQNLPVVGPIDVWLADHQWFDLNVYCAMVANEGWKNQGSPLVGQDRRKASTVIQSGRF